MESDPIGQVSALANRLKLVCAAMTRIADSTEDSGDLDFVVDCLHRDLPLYFADEATDLFPLLLSRRLKTDDLDRVIELLTENHGEAGSDIRRIRQALESVSMAEPTAGRGDDFVGLFRVFASRLYRHLTLATAVVLPFARLRLKPKDLRQLAVGMAARRGPDNA